MRNPLNKRIIRKILDEKIRFLALVVFLATVTGFCSGAVITADNLKNTYDGVKDAYKREDGNFALQKPLKQGDILKLESDCELQIRKNFYTEKKIIKQGKSDTSMGKVRIFNLGDRKNVNRIDMLKGQRPDTDKEIILDRLYCENNAIERGDTIFIGKNPFKVTGYCAMPDYSSLFSDNEDLMFDAKIFAVGAVTEEAFETFESGRIFYDYTWTYNRAPADETEEKHISDDLLENLFEVTAVSGNEIEGFIPEYLNQAINFTDRDFQGDREKALLFLYILTAVTALVFATEISGDIDREAKLIGSMKALGYMDSEICRHYTAVPILTVLGGGVAGNVLGYAFFGKWIERKYLNSYSLTHTVYAFNKEAFLLTTCVPALIIFLVTYGIIRWRLKLSPLNFINEDLEKHRRKPPAMLRGAFSVRFIKRILSGDKFVYACLFLGIFFANWMMFYGIMMPPMLKHHEEAVNDNLISAYCYYVRPGAAVGTGEKFTVYKMKTHFKGRPEEDVVLYGISDQSRYFRKKTRKMPPKGEVLMSTGLKEKYGLKKGDLITLKECYTDKKQKFKIGGTTNQPEGLGIYMSQKELNHIIGKKQGYFNGCFSDVELDIPEKEVLSVITAENLQKTAKQLTRSMEGFFVIMQSVAIGIYILVIYLLSKEVIEKNRKDISMMCILGYSHREIKRFYIVPTRIVFVVSLLINIPIGVWLSKVSMYGVMRKVNGWLSFYMPKENYLILFFTGIMTYGLIEWSVYRKMLCIDMADVLMDE